MSVVNCVRQVPVHQSPRVLQLLGLFDVPPTKQSEQRWQFDFPYDDASHPWNVGLVVGPSGSGKSTVAREVWPGRLVEGHDWPADRSLVDAFPKKLSIKEITGLLSSVGFSSPPAWLRPFACLSTGEQFRATVARGMAETPAGELLVIDEFTSVVDRTVAQVGSAAVAKAVRARGARFVAVTCHADVLEWLQPDWVLQMPEGEFTRRSLRRRPAITLEVARVHPSAWQLFKQHHYLNTELHKSARCFVAFVEGRPVAFASCLHNIGRAIGWREHRTVCLPDFQGVGIGNAVSDFVAGVMRGTGKKYYSTTANPAMIRRRAKSSLWLMTRRLSRTPQDSAAKNRERAAKIGSQPTRSTSRFTAGFTFVGPARPDLARAFGLV